MARVHKGFGVKLGALLVAGGIGVGDIRRDELLAIDAKPHRELLKIMTRMPRTHQWDVTGLKTISQRGPYIALC